MSPAPRDAALLHDLVSISRARAASAPALTVGRRTLTYDQLCDEVARFASGLMSIELARGDRVAVYLEKRFETVIASFGTAAAGCVFVPVNPLLKPEQVAHIVRDCAARVLVTSSERLGTLSADLISCQSLRAVILADDRDPDSERLVVEPNGTSANGAFDDPTPARQQRNLAAGLDLMRWHEAVSTDQFGGHRVVDTDMTAILYTSGSTGRPKGVVLSHRNLVAGAKSVATYLENDSTDVLLAVLPLSFDAGFSQLTTGFFAGARVVLLNYLLPGDVLKAMAREGVTGITAVPPLYIQLTQIKWPESATDQLRYFANTGGRMPREVLSALRERAPRARPFLMYGLTEAFRSTYLPPDQVDHRPDSIGKAIPNVEVLVLRADGTECDADEPGELVHRGPLVALGYWNDAEKTAERYRLLPAGVGGRSTGLQLPEYAVFSGDVVRRDAEGYLYFVGRRDEMIKTSGYRVSPTEVEEVIYSTGLVAECAAFGVDHPTLGQAIQVVVAGKSDADELDVSVILAECRRHMPAYMIPSDIRRINGPLPRNPNGKIDRKLLASRWTTHEGDA